MKRHARKAFTKLKRMGVNVKDSTPWNEAGDNRGHFWISCEGPDGDCKDDRTELHCDYYGNFWGSDKLNKVLEDNGLYFEWYNPAYACVWDA